TYTFTVAEDAATGTTVGTVSATDPNDEDSVTHSITAGNGDGKFSIDGSSGSITVAAALDYETTMAYSLTVQASDGKENGTATATVAITVTNVAEDPPPAPEDLSVSLADDTFSLSWTAVTGADQYRVQYRTGGSESEWTSLDAVTAASQTFSPENGALCATTYEFQVQAHGDGETYLVEWGAASESASHTTEACNLPPAFGSATYTFTVAEDAATGTTVGTVSATDPNDEDSVTHSITAGNGDGKFSIDGSSGSITVAAALDYETTTSYSLTVQASDGKENGAATATVAISITNVAEAPPPAPYRLPSVYNDGVFQLSWRSVAGADQYRLQYRIGDATGSWTNLAATTNTYQNFTLEGRITCGTIYEFRSQAHGDGETYSAIWGSPSSAAVFTAHPCNQAPAFGSETYTFTVAEDAATGTTVGTVSATDPNDEDSVTHSITAGNGDGKFSIDGSSGSITVAAALDYETTMAYSLTVQASDGKENGTATATVAITVTNVAEDPPPAPEDLSVSLADDTFSLSWTAVTGADQYRVQYRTGGSESEWTSLDAVTAASQTFSPENGALCATTYEFQVQAHGDGETYLVEWGAASESASHTTEACNLPPAFGSATYTFTVAEDAATGTTVGTVSATDPNDEDSVTHSITAGNGDGKFSIDGSSGSITVAAALDYETTTSYSLTVQASDGKENGAATATVAISITNVAEAPPPAPQNLTGTVTHNSVTLSWDAPDDTTVTSYQILRRRPDHGETELLVHVADTESIDDTESIETTYTDTDVAPGTRYVYRVKAINAIGLGPFSKPVTVTTAQQP
ncbi:MAG: hypothetical protein F4X83_09185, partial [Chloroflexi bacterium]|nr:hypothetical protein [Chloroflexota bacterium]